GAVVTLFAPDAVRRCIEIGAGEIFAGEMGSPPLSIRGRVLSLHDGKWVETEARHGGRRHNDQGPTAVLDLGGNTLVLNSLRTPPFSLGQLTSVGIEPGRARVLVVKAAVAHRAAYAPVAAETIEVDTPGVTAIDVRRFRYHRVRRPMFPLDEL